MNRYVYKLKKLNKCFSLCVNKKSKDLQLLTNFHLITEEKMKLLPFPKSPILLCYHNRAFPFGIIQANSPVDITKWACTKCVNCNFFSTRLNNKFNIAVHDVWGIDEGLVEHQIVSLSKDDSRISDEDLLQDLKDAINNDYYISGIFNEKHVPNKWTYESKDFVHDFLIIGYEDDRFISVGYVSSGKFERFEIPNKNLACALRTVPDAKIKLNLYKYNVESRPKPCIERMIDDLKKYISTTDYFYNQYPKASLFGIAACVRLKMFFVDEIQQGKNYVDRRYSLAFYEHKWILSKLVELFLDPEESKQYQESVNRNLEKAKLVHLLGLKITYSRDIKLISHVIELMDEIIADEIQYIPSLIELLQKKYLVV